MGFCGMSGYVCGLCREPNEGCLERNVAELKGSAWVAGRSSDDSGVMGLLGARLTKFGRRSHVPHHVWLSCSLTRR